METDPGYHAREAVRHAGEAVHHALTAIAGPLAVFFGPMVAFCRPVVVFCRPALTRVRTVARHRRTWAGGRALVACVVTLVGVALGVLLLGRVGADVGPFRAEFAAVPSLHGGSKVTIPPLGSLLLRTHSGPAQLVVRLDSLDQKRTEAIVSDPNGVVRASETAVTDVSRGVHRLAFQVAGVSLLGAMALAALVYRSMRRVALCGGLALALVVGTALVTAATFRVNSIEEPRYEGLLSNAPAVVGNARRIAGQYEEYQAELQGLVLNVGKLYTAVSTLPVYEPDAGTIRVLHISDLHLNPTAWSVVQTVAQQFNVNLVIDTGDITDWGSEPEASYVASIGTLKVPYVYVRGNHDSARTAAAVASQPNAIVLENTVATVDGLTIAGIGDPRFTPDKSTDQAARRGAGDILREDVDNSGRQLAATIRAAGRPVDIALVHDPASADPLASTCRLVLAGHLHHREIRQLPAPTGAPKAPGAATDPKTVPHTLLMVEGSTGGAGLRGLESTEPLPLAASVLYFDQEHHLQAYDDIQVGGTGQAQVALERHIIKPEPTPVTSGSSGPSPTSSR